MQIEVQNNAPSPTFSSMSRIVEGSATAWKSVRDSWIPGIKSKGFLVLRGWIKGFCPRIPQNLYEIPILLLTPRGFSVTWMELELLKTCHIVCSIAALSESIVEKVQQLMTVKTPTHNVNSSAFVFPLIQSFL